MYSCCGFAALLNFFLLLFSLFPSVSDVLLTSAIARHIDLRAFVFLTCLLKMDLIQIEWFFVRLLQFRHYSVAFAMRKRAKGENKASRYAFKRMIRLYVIDSR